MDELEARSGEGLERNARAQCSASAGRECGRSAVELERDGAERALLRELPRKSQTAGRSLPNPDRSDTERRCGRPQR